VEKAANILRERMRPYNEPLADQLEKVQGQVGVTPPSGEVDLTGVVNRIVSYLQISQEQLVTVNRQTREFWELEGQALKLNRNLAANKLQAFLRMAQKVDETDPYNPLASLQVSALAETLGQILDFSTLKLRRLRLAGLLFRVGLAEAPKEVFDYNTKNVNSDTHRFWQDRPSLGARLLTSMPELKPITNIIRHQLEYWDGSGYPDGLKGEDIPIESRIIGLVAYFQELTQPRGDRLAYSLVGALAKCQKYSGTRFDPNLLESLNSVIRLTEMGLMKLPDRPSQLPSVWLEETKMFPKDKNLN
jgi:HD-GYP domain-containing protein (c-di-GMP phosphodiesterase class II)